VLRVVGKDEQPPKIVSLLRCQPRQVERRCVVLLRVIFPRLAEGSLDQAGASDRNHALVNFEPLERDPLAGLVWIKASELPSRRTAAGVISRAKRSASK
jgi:hypothetical protein